MDIYDVILHYLVDGYIIIPPSKVEDIVHSYPWIVRSGDDYLLDGVTIKVAPNEPCYENRAMRRAKERNK